MYKSLPCIVCSKELEDMFHDASSAGGWNQPLHATAFTTPGHYGSGVFDPCDGSALEINICDECLKTARDHCQVILNTSPASSKKIWNDQH